MRMYTKFQHSLTDFPQKTLHSMYGWQKLPPHSHKAAILPCEIWGRYSEHFAVRQDGAGAQARDTVDLLKQMTPYFILHVVTNLDLNPINYAVWETLQDHIYKNQIKDAEEVEEEWDSLD